MMKRYIALLRGINISGKNKITMIDLKVSFIELGYTNVVTHLNSGNVVFSCEELDEVILANTIGNKILDLFGFSVPVFILSQNDLKRILIQAPSWWGTDNKDIYDNLIFVMGKSKARDIADRIGEPSNELEQICICNNSIFWSFDRKNYSKANWWKKTASSGIGEMITIRTANTVRKIVEM